MIEDRSSRIESSGSRISASPSIFLHMESTYFRKGFGLKGEIEGQRSPPTMPAASSRPSAPRTTPLRGRAADLPAGPGVRLLLRRRPGGGVRLRDPPQVPRPAALPGGRDHPQPAREREARARWGSIFLRHEPGRRVRLLGRHPRGRGDPAGVRRDDDATSSGCARIGCVLVDTTCGSVLNVWKRVESYARDGFTARDPRQVLPRGDPGDGVAR